MGDGIRQFAQFRLDLDRGELREGRRVRALRRQSFEVLCYLVERSGHLVSKTEIIRAVWGDTPASDDSLTHCLIDIRKALRDTERNIVKTVPRRGYLFDLPVETVPVVPTTGLRRGSRMMVAVGAALLFMVAGVLMIESQERNDYELAAVAEHSEALDLYLQGRFMFQRRAEGDNARARQYFLDAIDVNEHFADAWAGLAGTYVIDYSVGGGRDVQTLDRLKEAAERAVAIDPTNTGGWLRLSHYYVAIDDEQAAARMFDRARSADPDVPLFLSVLAGKHLFAGDVENAIRFQARAVAKDPLSAIDRINLSYFLFAAGRYFDALEENRRAHDLRPFIAARDDPLQGFALILLERYADALDVIETWPDGAARSAALAMANHRLGRLDEAVAAMRALQLTGDPITYIRRAELFAFCNELEQAISTLRQMGERFAPNVLVRLGESGVIDELFASPFLMPVRSDPRWQSILDDIRGESPVVAHLVRQQDY